MRQETEKWNRQKLIIRLLFLGFPFFTCYPTHRVENRFSFSYSNISSIWGACSPVPRHLDRFVARFLVPHSLRSSSSGTTGSGAKNKQYKQTNKHTLAPSRRFHPFDHPLDMGSTHRRGPLGNQTLGKPTSGPKNAELPSNHPRHETSGRSVFFQIVTDGCRSPDRSLGLANIVFSFSSRIPFLPVTSHWEKWK
jgi:hypothetical protein